MQCRTTFAQLRASRIPRVMGECASNLPALASIVNEAQMRLIQSGGDTGWWGSYAKMVFNVDPEDPFLTTPREVARLINVDVCRAPVRVQNQFYEFLQFGSGLQRKTASCSKTRCDCNNPMQLYDRGTYPTFVDITPGSRVRVYLTNAADISKRVFFQAIDSNDMPIYTIDNGVQVSGFFLNLDPAVPFVDSPTHINSISGIQKDITVGPVQIYEVDPDTDEQTLIATLAPGEEVACYRRYFLGNLPGNCCECDSAPGMVQVTAMAKLEFIPVRVDTDYLLIGNIPALKAECQSIRYSEMDEPAAMQMAELRHREAIRLLNKELVHYEGKELPAIQFKPFGNATLERVGLQMI